MIRQAVVAGVGDGAEDLGARGLLHHQGVLLELVLVAAEAGLVHRPAGELGNGAAGGVAHGGDDPVADLEGELPVEALVGAPGGGDGGVHVVEHALAPADDRRRRAAPAGDVGRRRRGVGEPCVLRGHLVGGAGGAQAPGGTGGGERTGRRRAGRGRAVGGGPWGHRALGLEPGHHRVDDGRDLGVVDAAHRIPSSAREAGAGGPGVTSGRSWYRRRRPRPRWP